MVERHLLPERTQEGHSECSLGQTGADGTLCPGTSLLFIPKDVPKTGDASLSFEKRKEVISGQWLSTVNAVSKSASQLDVVLSVLVVPNERIGHIGPFWVLNNVFLFIVKFSFSGKFDTYQLIIS